jgi:hypothetical protein
MYKTGLCATPRQRSLIKFVGGRAPVKDGTQLGSRGMVGVKARTDITGTAFGGEKSVAAV